MKYINFVVFGAATFIFTFVTIDAYVVNRKVYKQIKFNQLNNRAYIYECYMRLSSYEDSIYWCDKFITYLELNVENVSGEWPDKSFLKITESRYLIRLTKLEERWLKINE